MSCYINFMEFTMLTYTFVECVFFASNSNFQSERGLWGDTFCIRWLSKWFNIPIGVWSLKMKTRYLFLNHDLDSIPLNIFFMIQILLVDILNPYYTKDYLDATLYQIIPCHLFANILKTIINPLFMKCKFMDCI